jgi:phage baseplate assembly protein W
MLGMNRTAGTPLSDMGHIRQSIGDIITTPVGTRVMRRDYGSHVFDLVDAPGNSVGALRLVAAVADALDRWEPRVRVISARVLPAADGRATVSITAMIKASGDVLTTDVGL